MALAIVCCISLFLYTCEGQVVPVVPGVVPVSPGFRPGPGPAPAFPIRPAASIVHGTCYFNDTYSPVKGRVDIQQDLQMTPPLMEVRVQIYGLPASTMSDAEHAMHVHQWGDLMRNCYAAGPHFDADPFSRHGGPAAMSRTERHDGDFGNLRQTNQGVIDTTFNVQNMMLVGDRGILGRSIVIHEGRDDLGRGNTPMSMQTGNAGAPIACCVIGLSDSWNWNNPILSNGKFVNQGGINIMG